MKSVINWSKVKDFVFSKKAEWRSHVKWRARDVASPLRTELANVYKNIAADESLLDGMTVDVGECCHSCKYGDRWTRVYDRLGRRVDRADQLTRKLWYDAGNYGPVQPVRSWRL